MRHTVLLFAVALCVRAQAQGLPVAGEDVPEGTIDGDSDSELVLLFERVGLSHRVPFIMKEKLSVDQLRELVAANDLDTLAFLLSGLSPS